MICCSYMSVFVWAKSIFLAFFAPFSRTCIKELISCHFWSKKQKKSFFFFIVFFFSCLIIFYFYPEISPKWHILKCWNRPKMTYIEVLKSLQNDISGIFGQLILIPKNLSKTTDCRKKYIGQNLHKMTFRKTF